MRFQDAAPGRAGGRLRRASRPIRSSRARPTCSPSASLDQRILARAVMNGDVDGRRRLAGDVPDPVRPRRRRRPDASASSEAILAASLEVAERGEQVRSQFRGAIVESLTERLLRRRPRRRGGRPPSGASGGSCSTASAPRSTRTTSRSRSTAPPRRSTASGAPAASRADVLHQLDDARQHAADEDERARRRRSSSSTPRGRARSGSTARRRRTTATRLVGARGPRRTLARSLTARDAMTASARRPARRSSTRRATASGSTRPARTACSGRRASCATPRTSPGSTRPRSGSGGRGTLERGLTWLVRSAELEVLAPIPMGADVVGADAGRRDAPRSSPGGAASSTDDDGTLVGLGPHGLGPDRRAGRADPDPGRSSARRSGSRRRRARSAG